MSLLKSLLVPAATVGAICGILAATAPADAAGRGAALAAQQECNSRVNRGIIRFQSQYDQCIRQQTSFNNQLFQSSPEGQGVDAFLTELEGLGIW